MKRPGWLERLALLQPHEVKAAIASFSMVFLLMASYFVLRPIRDAMASDWSDTDLSLLWNIQFFLSIGLVALYSLLLSKVAFRWVVPLVYTLFALSFIAFYLIAPLVGDPTLLEQAFYLWVAAFSLFNLSVFWSFMSDVFSPEQGRRLFAIIAAGASLGAIVGPMLPVLLAEQLGLDALMLIAAVGLLLVVPLIAYIQHLKRHEPASTVYLPLTANTAFW